MVREADHHGSTGVTLSSIDLLQERFRQLQKMKKLRQEKELLRMLSGSSERHVSPPPMTRQQEQLLPSTKFSGLSELIILPPYKPRCELSLSLWPDSPVKNSGSGSVFGAPSSLSKSWFADAPLACASPIKLENSASDYIDTSLHL